MKGKQTGFSTLDEQVASGLLKVQVHADIALGANTEIGLAYDHLRNADRRVALPAQCGLAGGARRPLFRPDRTRWRGRGKWPCTDLGFRAICEPSDDLPLCGLAQTTVARLGTIARNVHVGVRGSLRLSDAATIAAGGRWEPPVRKPWRSSPMVPTPTNRFISASARG